MCRGCCRCTMSGIPLLIMLLALLAVGIDGEKRELRVAGFSVTPYMNVEAIRRGDFPAGVDVEVLDTITRKLNYSYVIKPTMFPAMNINGSWFGGIGELVAGRADVGIGHISLIHPRLQYIDMAYHMYTTDHLILAVKARPLAQHFNLLKAFSPVMWSLTAVATIAMCILQPLMSTMALRGSQMTTVDSLMLVIGIILHQGQSFGSKQKFSTTLSILNWLIFALFIWLAFETDLLSYLISVDYEREIDTVDDILITGRPFLTIFGRPSLNGMGFSPRESNQMVMAITEREKTHVYLDRDVTDNVVAIRDSYGSTNCPVQVCQLYIFVALRSFGFNPFKMGKEVIYIQHTGLAFQKGSSLTSQFHYHLQYLVAGGLVNQMMVRNMPLERKEGQKESTDIPLIMQHFSLAFGLLAAGLLLSLILFVLEMKGNGKGRKKRAIEKGMASSKKMVWVQETPNATSNKSEKEELKGKEQGEEKRAKDENVNTNPMENMTVTEIGDCQNVDTGKTEINENGGKVAGQARGREGEREDDGGRGKRIN